MKDIERFRALLDEWEVEYTIEELEPMNRNDGQYTRLILTDPDWGPNVIFQFNSMLEANPAGSQTEEGKGSFSMFATE